MADDKGTKKGAQAEEESSNEQQHDLKSFGSNSVRRTMLSNAKFEVEKFHGNNNFGM